MSRFIQRKPWAEAGPDLGLSIVWGTVKDHNGYIDVKTRVGEGTTFTLYFPVTREELTAPQQKVPMEQYMGNGESVWWWMTLPNKGMLLPHC